MKAIHIIEEDGSNRTLAAEAGQTLIAILLDHGYDIPSICGGTCCCGTCHIFIDESWYSRIPEASEEEKAILFSIDDYNEGRSRLACQIEFSDKLDNLILTIADNYC